jgi:hypothetical protein
MMGLHQICLLTLPGMLLVFCFRTIGESPEAAAGPDELKQELDRASHPAGRARSWRLSARFDTAYEQL